MTNAMVTLGIVVGGTSLICYALMTRGCRTAVPIADHRATARERATATMVVETAGAFPTGSVAIIPWIVRAIRATRAAAIAAEAAMAAAVAEAINAAGLPKEQPH